MNKKTKRVLKSILIFFHLDLTKNPIEYPKREQIELL
jgi:hypothetical protein